MRISNTTTHLPDLVATKPDNIEASPPTPKNQTPIWSRTTREPICVSKHSFSSTKPDKPGPRNITCIQRLIQKKSILPRRKLQTIIIIRPNPPNFDGLGPPTLIHSWQPRGGPETSTLNRLGHPARPPTIAKKGPNSKMWGNLSGWTVQDNTAAAIWGHPTIKSQRLPPQETLHARLLVEAGCWPVAKAQETSRSTQSPAEIPFARQGILVGSTLKSPTNIHSSPLATTLNSPRAASKSWSVSKSCSGSVSAPWYRHLTALHNQKNLLNSAPLMLIIPTPALPTWAKWSRCPNRCKPLSYEPSPLKPHPGRDQPMLNNR